MRYYFVSRVGSDSRSGKVKVPIRFLEREAATREWGEKTYEKEALEWETEWKWENWEIKKASIFCPIFFLDYLKFENGTDRISRTSASN